MAARSSRLSAAKNSARAPPASQTAPTFFAESAAFRRWLRTHSAKASELVVGFYKVGSGRPSMTWPASVDEALCFGWIDGIRKRIDDESYCIRFTPRRRASMWSAVNVAKYRQLDAAGRITPAGANAFARRRVGESAVHAHEPRVMAELSAPELSEFKRDKAAWKFFQATPPGYRRVVLHWVTAARKSETRASRLATLLTACRLGKRLR